MARFYFHLYGDAPVLDEEGVELPDVAAALYEAKRSARALASTDVLEDRLRLSNWIDVARESGKVVGTVRFGDAVAVEE